MLCLPLRGKGGGVSFAPAKNTAAEFSMFRDTWQCVGEISPLKPKV